MRRSEKRAHLEVRNTQINENSRLSSTESVHEQIFTVVQHCSCYQPLAERYSIFRQNQKISVIPKNISYAKVNSCHAE